MLDFKKPYDLDFWDWKYMDPCSISSGVSCESFTDGTNFDYDCIINGWGSYKGNMVSIVEYMYYNKKDYFSAVNMNSKNTICCEICKLWTQKFCGTRLE